MKRISFFKKVKLFFTYRKIVNEISDELNSGLNIRIDNANRMYTVLNIPENIIGDEYTLIKSERNRISDVYIKEYINTVAKFLNSKGLNELYSVYRIDRVEKLSYLIVFGFSLFKSHRFYNNLLYKIIPIIIIISIISYFILC